MRQFLRFAIELFELADPVFLAGLIDNRPPVRFGREVNPIFSLSQRSGCRPAASLGDSCDGPPSPQNAPAAFPESGRGAMKASRFLRWRLKLWRGKPLINL
jgi:hypothetical protein